ncbi:M23 family metallopeptidase [Microbacterium lushaniae]|uniref:M23 family metallopeptidase n=1 Tax=Microbacterium lushaniae TaxID=2614639 RepID=A0A5J6L8V2_9MICO|nr:M23 family metallopeptidase [Microbacterium lushaniae]
MSAVAVAAVWALTGTAPPVPVERGWTWPTAPVQIVRPFVAPAHAYGAGHRGIDLTADGAVRSPADGVIAYSGIVVDRGVLTIDHGDGLVTTFEPVESALRAGEAVTRGQEVAEVSSGGHTADGAVHFGVRRNGDYINPLLMLGGVPRAILLPCC